MPRPKLIPTDEERRLVVSLSALGIPQLQIARRLGIRSLKTLRKHYRKELDRGNMEANASVAKALFTMATSGQHPAATIFWLKCRAGWKEYPVLEPRAAAPPVFVVVKDDGVKEP